MNSKNKISRRSFIKTGLKTGTALAAAPAILGGLPSCQFDEAMFFLSDSDPRLLDLKIQNRFRREPIAHLPTPLEKMDALTAELAGPQLYIKRDDQTGLAFGGNKTRKLEYIMADVLDQKADVIITYAGEQSNWARQTVAAAKKFGVKPVVVLTKKQSGPVHYDGNLLLDAIFGADIRLIEPGADRTEVVAQVTEEYINKGHHPYVVSVGGSSVGGSMTVPLGAMAYSNAFLETHWQAKEIDVQMNYLVHATGSGGTQAGLVVGAKSLSPNTKVVGISVGGAKTGGQKSVSTISNQIVESMHINQTYTPEEIVIFDEYVGEGYGILNQQIVNAIKLVAQKEGILLDPVYTGKAFAGLIDLINQGYFKKDDNVVFVHTGGTPALFPYKEQIMDYLNNRKIM